MLRKLIPAICLAAGVVTAQGSSREQGASVANQLGPTLRVVDSLVIGAAHARAEFMSRVFAGPGGQLMVKDGDGDYVAFDSTGRRRWSQDPGREADIFLVTSVGWRGDTVWIFDAGRSRISLLDGQGNVEKSFPLPATIRSAPTDGKRFPVFGAMTVHALFPDGSMIVRPRRPRTSVSSAGYDTTYSYLMRVSAEGLIQNSIARLTHDALPDSPESQGGPQVFDRRASKPLFRVSSDGARAAVVEVATSNRRIDTVIVRTFSDRGEVVYTRKFAMPAVAFTEAQIDSIANRRFGTNDAAYRAKRSKDLPRRWPAVYDLTMDADKSVWLTFRASETSRQVVGIDPSGKVIGTFRLPANRVVKGSDRGRPWIGDSPQGRRRDLIRYTFGK